MEPKALRAWRDGIAKWLSRPALEALARGLEEDDPRLIQGCTTEPPALTVAKDFRCEGACPIAYAGWIAGKGTAATVAEVEEYMATIVNMANLDLNGEAYAFLNWIDETPRDDMRRELLAEVNRELARRTC
jgi:hypothetical protein